MNSTIATSVSLDTNILFYAFDRKVQAKHFIAYRIISALSENAASAPLQILYEFYRVATRKALMSPHQAAEIVNNLRSSMIFHPIATADLTAAMRLHREHKFQFYDCLILSTAIRVGCTTFLTEDFQHGRVVEGVTILNPFLLTHAELDALLA